MRAGNSVIEVGCGGGAFLYPLREAGLRVAGLDYSAALVAAARAAIPDGDFREAEASEFAAAPRSADFVVANSVFQYFADDDYANSVLTAMLTTACKAVAVLEVPDLDCRGDAEAARRALLSECEYEAKYAGLAHRYYRRDTFRAAAIQYGFDAEICQQSINGYAQNAFRFNCLLRKITTA
jgi:trans-aconitate methyltransferase